MFPGSTDVGPTAVNVMLPPPTVIVGLVANAPPSKRPNVEYVIKAAYEVVGMAPPRVCDTSKRLTIFDVRVCASSAPTQCIFYSMRTYTLETCGRCRHLKTFPTPKVAARYSLSRDRSGMSAMLTARGSNSADARVLTPRQGWLRIAGVCR